MKDETLKARIDSVTIVAKPVPAARSAARRLARHLASRRVKITFDPATAKQYYDKAYEVGWASVTKASPQYGPQLRKLFSR